MKTTFEKIKSFTPCTEGWKKLIGYYQPEDLLEEISIEEIIKSNGIEDAVWALRAVDDKERVILFSCDVAEMVLCNFEKEFPENKDVRNCIEVTRKFAKGLVGDDELESARFAAWSAAWSAAESAARSAESAWSAAWSAESAWSAAESAARSAESAWSAAWSAESAWSAAWSAAESAAWSAESARSAAESAAWSAESARSAAWVKIQKILLCYFNEVK